MASMDVSFSRDLLRRGHKVVKDNFPDVNLRHDAWVWCAGRDHWEFHGPKNFFWHGRAGTAYEARYKGWMAWLEHQGVNLDEYDDFDD